jgi:hypothetical protein
MPDNLAVICPRCSKEASFQPPFEFYREDESVQGKLIRWNNSLVKERFASVFPWADADNPFKSLFWGTHKRSYSEYPIWGVLSCGSCTLLRKHRLNWPSDAYYAATVKGEVLWAWDRATFVDIESHIASVVRAKRSHILLKYLPRHFLIGKNRSSVVKAVREKLSNS